MPVHPKDLDLDSLSINYLAGGHSECPDSWKYIDITPAYNKLWFIVGGECLLEVNGQEFIARPYHLYFLPAGSTQTYYNISDDHVVQDWFHFSADCGGEDLFKQIELPFCIEIQDVPYVTELFYNILQLDAKMSMVEFFTQKYLMLELLAYYIERSSVLGVKKVQDTHINSIIRYISEHLDQELSLRNLSEYAHFHPSYFSRYFKRKTGLLPLEYVKQARIERAQKLLETEDFSIKKISCMVGISDVSYFTKLFKKKTGFTPSDYRSSTRSLFLHEGFDSSSQK